MASREKQYIITMGFRIACFISIFFVHGWLRWVVLAGAVFLPFIAVLFANQRDTKHLVTTVEHGEPSPATQLTTGAEPVGEVIEGELAEDDPDVDHADSDRRFSTPARDDTDHDDEGWSRRERVA